MKLLSLPCLGLALLTAGTTASAQPPPPDAADRQSEAYQASVTQDGLKRDAASIRAELVRVRDQMRQVLPDDAAAVDRAIQQMDALSRDEMDRVVQTLRGASKPEGLSTQAQSLADVLRGQGAISTGLKRLAISLDARQSAEGLAAELSTLLGRQVAARDELVRLSVRDKTPDRLHNRDRERYEVVNDDQKSISDDIKLLFGRMEHVAQNLTPDAQPNFVPAVNAARDGKLADLADAAAAQTAQGPFDQATASQGQVAALLVAMEQALGGGVRPADRLAALQEKLRQTLDQQQALTQTIAGFHERQSVEDQTKRLQTTLTDQIAQLRTEMQPLNSQAAAELQSAQDATEAASLNYNRMWEERASAQENTRNATAHLAAALADVDRQAAALASQTPQTPAQADAALAALQRDTALTAEVARNIAAAAPSPTNTGQQKGLESTVAALQQRALPLSSDVAKDLGNAAADLQQPGQAGAQAAAQQLAQAAQDIAKQQAGQQAMAQAEAQVAQASQGLAQAQANMASPQTSAEAVNEMNAVKQEVANAQAAAAKAGAPAAAQAALAEAARDVAQAQNAAAGVQLPQAQAAAQSAQVAMAKAGQGMGTPEQQAQAQGPMVSKAGNNEGKRSGDGGTPQGQGNGGGGKSGDFLAGAGANAEVLAPVSGLNPQDRAAVTQLQTEKPPADFAPEVQQYYKNIADGVGL